MQLNEVKKDPGRHYQLEVRAPQGTRLGLLSVDQSVYLLRNENRLTKDRVSGVALQCYNSSVFLFHWFFFFIKMADSALLLGLFCPSRVPMYEALYQKQ